MKLYSTGEAAAHVGVTRDSLLSAIRNARIPDAATRIGGRRFFSSEEVKNISEWFKARKKAAELRKTRKCGWRGNGESA